MTVCRILAGIACCFLSCLVSGESLVIEVAPVFHLDQNIEFVADKTGQLTIDEILKRKPSEFDSKSSSNFGFIQGAIWVVFRIRFQDISGNDVPEILYFDTGTSLPTDISYHHYYENRLLQKYETGTTRNFEQRPIANRNFVFPFTVKTGEHQVWFRIESRNMVSLIPTLKTIEGLASSGTKDGLLLGLLYGSVLILVVFCTIAYLWSREAIFLAVTTIALWAGIWHGVQTGLTFQYLWPESVFLNSEIQRISVVLLILSIAWMNRLLSQVYEWSQLLDRLFLISMALTSILLFVPIFKYSAAAGLLLISTSPLLMLIISVRAFQIKKGRGATHLMVTILFLVGIIYSVLKAYGVIPVNEYSEAIGEFEFVGLFMLLSILLAYKINEDRIQSQAVRSADEAKRSFLANMSHEIRTPLNAIMGFARLAFNAEKQDVQKKYIKYIQDSSDNMLALVNQILDLSKVEAGKLDLELRSFNLQSLSNNIQSMFFQAAADKDLKLTIEYDEGIPSSLIGDPLRISQILINLVGNSVKFTHSGEIKVTVSMSSADSKRCFLQFKVRDTGIGIDERVQEKIFNSFVQGEDSTTRNFGGTGLGLAITRQLVELMGGDIKLESEEGEGTLIVFYLSLEIDSEQPTGLISKEKSSSYDEKKIVQSEFGQRKPEKPVLDNIKILLVEDNDINQVLATTLLERAGMKVQLAVNGEDALNKLDENEYDLVLMDMQMPVMDGLEATRRIRTDLKMQKLPIIAMTANAMRASLDQCIEAGMNDFITKPIDPELLYQVIGRWIGEST